MLDNEPVESVWTDVGEAEMVEPEWIVKGVLPVGVTFIAGPPKSYKSAIELGLLLTACGVDNPTLPPDLSELGREPGRVLMLSMEALPGVIRHTAKEGMGVAIPSDGRFLAMSDPWKFRLDNPRDTAELLQWAEHLAADVLAIDPLRNCHSLDENDSGGMVQMIQPIQQWATKHKKAAVFVHHSKKIGEDKSGEKRMANANDMRGSSALFGLADAVLTVTAKGKALVHIDAILKRGEAWQRTIQLGLWGQTSTESIDSQTKMVFELLATGLKDAAIMAAMKLTKAEVTAAKTQLQRIGALLPDGSCSDAGPALVKGAVRKFSPAP